MRCCPTCRLLIDAERCAACAAHTVELGVQEQLLLEPPDIEVIAQDTMSGLRAFAAIATFTVLSFVPPCATEYKVAQGHWDVSEGARALVWIVSIGSGLVLCFALAAIVIRRSRSRKAHPRMSSVPALSSEPGGESAYVGVARKHRASVTSFADGSACLASAVVARRGRGVVVWQRDSVEFLLERDGEDPVIVAGEVRLELPWTDHGTDTGGGLPLRARLSVPPIWRTDATLHTADLVDGMRVRVAGPVSREARPELASGYRDIGEVTVVRGRPGDRAVIALDE